MPEFPRFEYSNGDIKRAGKIIAGDMAWTDETEPKIREAFQIANSWRDAHAFPMRSVRYSVLGHMRGCGLSGISAARLKRMQAIRRKLRRIPHGLHQLQDLGGCRIILPMIEDVHTLVGRIRGKVRHQLRDEDDYITAPKDDGYRSHHLMFRFVGKNDTTVFDGKRIELQIRTRNQHAWATSIEAVGLFRNERLKNHEGSAEWLRLFLLMSAEFAEAERCAVSAGTPDKRERREEIRFLAWSLRAMDVLDSVGYGVRGTDIPLSPGYRPSHYLIRFDHATKTVRVEPQNRATVATRSYDNAENLDNQTGEDTENVVLVEVGKIEDLKAAYPNYFGDVDLFKTQLRAVALGHAATEYHPVPRQTPSLWQKAHTIDPAWMRRNPFRPTDEVRLKKRER